MAPPNSSPGLWTECMGLPAFDVAKSPGCGPQCLLLARDEDRLLKAVPANPQLPLPLGSPLLFCTWQGALPCLGETRSPGGAGRAGARSAGSPGRLLPREAE